MLKSLLITVIILTQVIPLISVNHTNNSVTSLNPDSYITVTVIDQPKNLELLQFDLENHTVLNTSQVEKLFIPQSVINKTLQYLKSFNINAKSYLNVIVASGKVKDLEKAFNGKFYSLTFNNITFYKFEGDPPGFIGPATIIGTNITEAIFKKPDTLYNVTQAEAFSVVTPKDLRLAYNVTSLLKEGVNGKGTNIGILDFYGDPYISQQLAQFDKLYNISNPPVFNVVPIGPYNPNDGILNGWALEISLDVEYSHEIAPDAGIYLYVANPSISLPAAIAYIDQQDKVNVVSESFGIPEICFDLGILPLSCIQSLDYEYWLGEVEGITFVAASGDYGGDGYNYYLFPNGSLLFPASDPYVVAVGGSTLYVSGNSSIQTAWSGESVYGSTTGGYSSIFPSPWYQGAQGFREVPDVVADGNPYTGVPVLYYYNETYLIGGTSVATPTTAGIIDLATQIYGKLGFINPIIYKLNGTKAITPIAFGYNTPYTVRTQGNPVTGLGYINAGYFVNILKMLNYKSQISVAVENESYLNGQSVSVVVKAPSYFNLKGYVYDGKSIIEEFPLYFNGTYWIGNFIAEGSGVQEVIISDNNESSGTYIVVGLQAEFLLPEVGIYYQPGGIPILIQLLYPNGSVAEPTTNYTATIMSYHPLNNTFTPITSITLSKVRLINITLFGINITSPKYLYGIYNISENIGGNYLVKISNTFGFDEFVEGIYVVPYIIPSVFTEPEVASPGSNITVGIVAETVGSPNVSVLFYKNGKLMYETQINSICIDNNQYYIGNVKIPNNLTQGYYTVIAKAVYANNNYIDSGVGFTQIYISSNSLSSLIYEHPKVVIQGTNIILEAKITYPNGTPVKYGTFTAVLLPSFLSQDFDSLSTNYAYPLSYYNGVWIANISVINGSLSNSLGLSQEALSSNWYGYVFGVSASGDPTYLPSSINFNTLNIIPEIPQFSFILLPYTYIKYFNGSYAYGDYINYADIVNHNATIIDSIVRNITVINGSVKLINTQLYNYSVINGTIIFNGTVKSYENNIIYPKSFTTVDNTTTKVRVNNNVVFISLPTILSLTVVIISTIITILLIKKAKPT